MKVLIKYADILGKYALEKSQAILKTNLDLDPYHANSMIMFARLEVAKGQRAYALHILQLSENHVRTQRDQQLIIVEKLRQLAAPRVISELDEIEKKLGLVLSESETGKPFSLPPNFNEDIDMRLKAIALMLKYHSN